MDVEHAVGLSRHRQLGLREVDGAGGRALRQELHQAGGDLAPDVGLRFLCRATDVRRQDDVGQTRKLSDKAIGVLFGLLGVDVDRRARQVTTAQRRTKGRDINDGAPAGV